MVASFAVSDAGRLYAMTCARYGIDPATIVDDDVLGYNMRVALALADVRDADDDAPVSEFARADAVVREAFG